MRAGYFKKTLCKVFFFIPSWEKSKVFLFSNLILDFHFFSIYPVIFFIKKKVDRKKLWIYNHSKKSPFPIPSYPFPIPSYPFLSLPIPSFPFLPFPSLSFPFLPLIISQDRINRDFCIPKKKYQKPLKNYWYFTTGMIYYYQ